VAPAGVAADPARNPHSREFSRALRCFLREPAVRVHFLGQPRFVTDGEAFVFRTRPRGLALLAFLLLHRDAHLTRDVVAFALWPDHSEEQARADLRRHLHNVTHALPPSPVPYLRTVDDTVGWNPDAPVWFDVDAFEAAVRDPTRAAEAVELYGGELLPGVFDDWIFPIRDRLARAYVAALERLLVDGRSRRDFTAAAAYAERILIHDPWREDAVRHLASIRYDAGDRAGALRVLDDFAQRLRAELHVDPMAETIALRGSILRGAALHDSARSDIAAGAPDAVFPFVGRTRDVDGLLAAWRRAARGRGEAIFIGGEAGIGKTRLSSELALRAATQGARVLRGATSSPEHEPYQVLVDALRDAAPSIAALDIRPIWLAALVPLLPELLLHRDDLPDLPALEPQGQTARLYEALASAINGLARRRPLVLILEDLHWAGAATLDAIGYLARRVTAIPALIIATYRSDERADAPELRLLRRTMQRENAIGHIALEGLDPAAVCELASTFDAFAGRSVAIGGEVHAASGGNPLFAGELLRERAESGAESVATSGLRSTLALRLGRLSETALSVAEIASVVGVSSDVDFVREVAGGDENAVLDALGELLERNVAREIGRAGFGFAFTHELMSAVIYDGIDERRRRLLHRRVAQVLERVAGPSEPAAASLAYHYDRGGDDARASEWYLAAAEAAFRVFANREALAAAERGLAIAVDTQRRCDLLRVHETVAARLGLRDAQEADIAALAALVPQVDDPGDAQRDVLWRRAALLHGRGRLADEAATLDELGVLARAAGDDARAAAVGLAVARNRLSASRYAEASAKALETLERFRERDDAAGEVECLCIAAEAAVNHGEAERVGPLLEEAQLRAQAAGDPVLRARARSSAAATSIMRRDFATARASGSAAMADLREVGDREGEASASVLVASASSLFPYLEEGRRAFNDAAEIYRALGGQLRLGYLLFNRSMPEIQLGLLDEAAESVAAAREIFTALDDGRGLACCATNLSVIRLLQGAPEEARALAQAALAGARSVENEFIAAGALANLGNAERELGLRDEAIANMQEAIAIRERLQRPATFEELSDLALTHLRFGEIAAARRVADEIERLAEHEENPVWPHCSYWACAQVYRAQGDAALAHAALQRAVGLIAEQRAAIVDERARAAFDALASVREVAAAHAEDRWPERMQTA
jgi:DNA-binding SARP family transcriptional activator